MSPPDEGGFPRPLSPNNQNIGSVSAPALLHAGQTTTTGGKRLLTQSTLSHTQAYTYLSLSYFCLLFKDKAWVQQGVLCNTYTAHDSVD